MLDSYFIIYGSPLIFIKRDNKKFKLKLFYFKIRIILINNNCSRASVTLFLSGM